MAAIRGNIVRLRLRRHHLPGIIITSLTDALRGPGSTITGVRLLLLRDRDCRLMIRTIITIITIIRGD